MGSAQIGKYSLGTDSNPGDSKLYLALTLKHFEDWLEEAVETRTRQQNARGVSRQCWCLEEGYSQPACARKTVCRRRVRREGVPDKEKSKDKGIIRAQKGSPSSMDYWGVSIGQEGATNATVHVPFLWCGPPCFSRRCVRTMVLYWSLWKESSTSLTWVWAISKSVKAKGGLTGTRAKGSSPCTHWRPRLSRQEHLLQASVIPIL